MCPSLPCRKCSLLSPDAPVHLQSTVVSTVPVPLVPPSRRWLWYVFYPSIYFFMPIGLLFPPQCCASTPPVTNRFAIWQIVCGVAWYASFILPYVHSRFSGISSNFNSIWACLMRYPWVRPFAISSCSIFRSSSLNVTMYLWFILHHPRILYHIFTPYAISISCLGGLLEYCWKR